jgi:hypothetical protein
LPGLKIGVGQGLGIWYFDRVGFVNPTEDIVMAKTIEITHLIKEVKELHGSYPHWTLDNAFVHWFLQAFLVPSAERAAEAVTGVSHDKGVDGVLVDDDVGKVFLLQGKFHQGPHPPLENRSDVMAFTQVAQKIASREPEFKEF